MQQSALWKDNCQPLPRALSIQPKIPVISVATSNGTDHFGLVRPEYSESALKVWSFWSVGPKCSFPFDKIVVPSTALLYPACKNNNQARGGLGRVCATGMNRSIEHVKFPKFLTGIFVEWKAPLVPRPHYYARPMRFGSRGPRKFVSDTSPNVALQLCPPLQFGPFTNQPIEWVFISSNQSALWSCLLHVTFQLGEGCSMSFVRFVSLILWKTCVWNSFGAFSPMGFWRILQKFEVWSKLSSVNAYVHMLES